jgi:hypothetical protein
MVAAEKYVPASRASVLVPIVPTRPVPTRVNPLARKSTSILIFSLLNNG